MRSLRNYLVGLTTLLVMLACIAAGLLIREIDRVGRAQTGAQLFDTTRALSLAVDGELQRSLGILMTLQASDAIRRHDWPALDRQARAAMAGPDAWIVVSGRSGRQFVNTHLPEGAALPAGRLLPELWAAMDKGKPRICNLSHGYIERNMVCVDMPLMENGRAAYALSVIMRPALFRSTVERQQVRFGHLATLVDRNGTVIWRNIAPGKYVGRQIRPGTRALIAKNPGGVLEATSMDGVPMLGAFYRSPLSGWTFIAAIPLGQAAAASDWARSWGVIGAVLLLSLGALAGLAAARRVTRAIDRLDAAALRYRNGDAGGFEPSGLREIDAVGTALDDAFAERAASEERFALAQEVGGIGAWDWDVSRDQGHVSETYKAMHGLAHIAGPLSLAQVLAVIHPDDLPGYLARLSAARERPEPSINEYRVVHADGSIHWVSAKGRPVLDCDGRFVRAVGVVRDVTADREAERALRELNEVLEDRVAERTAQVAESERRFRAIFDTTFQLTGLCALDGTLLVVNRAVLEGSRMSLEKIAGIKIWEAPWWARSPVQAKELRDSVRRVARGEFVRREVELAMPEGRRQFDFSMKPVLGEDGTPVMLVAEARDITDLKQTEEALRQSQKLESMGQLTGGVAHDFNNLLTPIVGSLDMLQRRGIGGAREQRLIEGALQSAEKAKVLVQRLLAFARRQPLQPTAVDLARLVSGMAELVASTSGPKVRVAVDLAPGLPPVKADPNQIEMAILNLSVNARDAMPDGGALTIAARAQAAGRNAPPEFSAGRYVCLSVSDTGIGMDEAVRARAVEPFFSTKGIGKGTGLGLSMVHGLAAQLGGALVIKSKPGLGTTIELWLPVAEEKAAEPDAVRAPEPATAAGTVLLVDDDDLVRASTADMLAEIGYAVIEAGSAEEALRLVEAGVGFDLLVTDHLMPGASGVDLAREMASQRPGTAVLIISGYADVDGIAPELRRLTKPFRQADLAACLAELHAGAHPLRLKQ